MPVPTSHFSRRPSYVHGRHLTHGPTGSLVILLSSLVLQPRPPLVTPVSPPAPRLPHALGLKGPLYSPRLHRSRAAMWKPKPWPSIHVSSACLRVLVLVLLVAAPATQSQSNNANSTTRTTTVAAAVPAAQSGGDGAVPPSMISVTATATAEVAEGDSVVVAVVPSPYDQVGARTKSG